MSPDLYSVGRQPPLGEIPERMHAWLVRRERYGDPRQAYRIEVVDTPEPGKGEVLVYVMAAGINYNGLWACQARPLDVIALRRRRGEAEDFHIAGSEGSGIVYRVGPGVTGLQVGDEVAIHGSQWDLDCPVVTGGGDPVHSPTFRAWGYESNFGTFAQFAKPQAHQCFRKPRHLTWEDAASYMAAGGSAWRMLHGHVGNTVATGDVVLVWGGAGGLGSYAIQIARAAGARPVAVVSSPEKFEFCRSLGAVGCVDRTRFDHWGPLPAWDDATAYGPWLEGARAFGEAVWEAVGERVNPRLVVEHPGQDTLPTSLYVCAQGGMVVICGGTSGYNGTLDLRYLWIRQKRLQGSHAFGDREAQEVTDLLEERRMVAARTRTFAFAELADAHGLMAENRHPFGNMAVLIGAPGPGFGASGAREA
jgi:crotonyl-CoA carboxylase/reductase